jgi:hypothetical protein
LFPSPTFLLNMPSLVNIGNAEILKLLDAIQFGQVARRRPRPLLISIPYDILGMLIENPGDMEWVLPMTVMSEEEEAQVKKW